MDEHDAGEEAGDGEPPEVGRKILKARPVPPPGKRLSDHPALVSEYTGTEDPCTVFAGTHKKLPWKCGKCGHEWEASGSSRVSGSGCRLCGFERVSRAKSMPPYKKSLAASPLASEYTGALDPKTIFAGTSKRLPWKCGACGHEWMTSGSCRARGKGCPPCGVSRIRHANSVPPHEKSLAASPLASEYAGDENPRDIFAGTARMLPWKCRDHGHIWMMSGCHRLGGRGCTICSGRVLLPGFNDLATTHPHLARQLVGTDPATVTAWTKKHLEWQCPDHPHTWRSTGSNRLKAKKCSVCAGRQVLVGFNDLATTHPHLAKQLVGTDPTTVVAGTNRVLEWKCPDHPHTWKSSGGVRVRGHGCRICAGNLLHTGFNDLATTHPHLARQLVGTDPATVMAGTHKKLEWQCPDHPHTWVATGNSRLKGSGCGVCQGVKVQSGFNDMATTHPRLARELIGDPRAVLAGTHKVLRWKCSDCNHGWSTTGCSRVAGSGCPKCAKFGFDPTTPAYIYMVFDSVLRRTKIGVAGKMTSRVHMAHRRSGWDKFIRIGPFLGVVVWHLERAVKRGLKAKGIATGADAFRDPFDGWTEAWLTDDLPVQSFPELFNALGIDVDAIGRAAMAEAQLATAPQHSGRFDSLTQRDLFPED